MGSARSRASLARLDGIANALDRPVGSFFCRDRAHEERMDLIGLVMALDTPEQRRLAREALVAISMAGDRDSTASDP